MRKLLLGFAAFAVVAASVPALTSPASAEKIVIKKGEHWHPHAHKRIVVIKHGHGHDHD